MPTLIKFGQLNPRWTIGAGLGVVAVASAGVVALFSGQNAAGIKTYEQLSDGSINMSGSLLAKSGSNILHWDQPNNRFGVGKRDPKTTLDVLGPMSGKLLTLSSLRNCTLKTSGTGNVTCGTDLTGGGSSFGSGQVVTIGDSRWLRTAGGTLTGVTTVDITGGIQSTIGLKIVNTLSGASLHAGQTLTTSGTLIFEGAASGATLYVATSINGAGLTDCDLATQTLAWDASTGRFSCGTDSDTTYSAGRGLGLTGTAFSLNSTISGALVRFTTLSGSLVYAKHTLASSGTLVFEGAASGSSLYLGTSLEGAGLLDCDSATATLAYDASTKRFSCGSDSDTTYTAGQGLTLTSTSFKTNAVMTGSLASFSTLSGSIVRARTTLASSGTLIWEGQGSGAGLYLGGTFEGVGLSDCDADSQSLSWDATTKRFVCGDDDNSGAWSNTGALQTSFDARYVNTSGDTMTGNLTLKNRELRITDSSDNERVIIDPSSILMTTAVGNTVFDVQENALSLWSTEDEAAPYAILDVNENTDNPYVIVSNSGTNVFDLSTQGNNPYFMMSNSDGTIFDLEHNNGSPYMLLNSGGNQIFELQSNGDDPSFGIANSNGTMFGFESNGNDPLFQLSDGSSTFFTVFNNSGNPYLSLPGTLSGNLLVLSNMRNCTLKTSGTGNVICGTDNTGAGGSNWSNTGSLSTAFDARYVRKKGDTMTGTLVIQNTVKESSGSLVLVPQEFQTGAYVYGSGAAILALDTYTRTKAPHILFGYRGTFDTDLYRHSPAVLATHGNLSGALLTMNGTGNNYFLGKLGIGTTTPTDDGAGAGGGNAIAMLHVKNNTSGKYPKFLLDGPADGGGFIQFLSAGATRADLGYSDFSNQMTFVTRIAGDIMTWFTHNGSSVGERMRLTAAGFLGIGTDTPATTLDVNGDTTTLTLNVINSMQGAGLTDCDAATQTLNWDSSTGTFSCGTDADTNTTYTAGRGLGLTGTSFSLNSTITGSLVRFATVSGTTVFGLNSVRSSGSLVWEGTATGNILKVQKNISGSGSLFIESGAYIDGNTLTVMAGPNRVGIGTASPLYPLYVKNNVTQGCVIGYEDSSGTTKSCIYVDSVNRVVNFGTVTADSFGYFVGSNAAALLIHYPSQNVGIGTLGNAPGSRLSVSGATVISDKGNLGGGAAKATLDVKGAMSGITINVTGMSATAVNNGLCLKSDRSIGWCSTALDALGNCTCN